MVIGTPHGTDTDAGGGLANHFARADPQAAQLSPRGKNPILTPSQITPESP
jgi:hypothetical protein